METLSTYDGYSCPADLDTLRLRSRVDAMYGRLAREPDARFHFNVGLEYAVTQLHYDRAELERLPASVTARFAGVGNPLRIGRIPPGARVLDHACGAGMDLLLAARRAGPRGHAIGVDLTAAMRQCAMDGARDAGLAVCVEIRTGELEKLPVDSASIDVVISNGVVNLAPDKLAVFREVRRVLRPGGLLYLADVVTDRELSPSARRDADLWAACVGGAATEAQLHRLMSEAGLRESATVEHFDCFRNTALALKLGGDLKVHGASFIARA